MSPLTLISDGEPVTLGPPSSPLTDDLRRSSVPLDFFLGGGGIGMVGGRVVSHARIANSQSTIVAARQRRLTLAAPVPLKLYERIGENERRRLGPKDHRLAEAFITPWERAGRIQLVSSLLGPLDVHGNGTVEFDEGRAGKIRFKPLDYRAMRPLTPIPGEISGWESTEDPDVGPRPLGVDKVLHVYWWQPEGPVGISPIAQAGTQVRIAEAIERHQEALMRNQARPGSVWEIDTQLLGSEPAEVEALIEVVRQEVREKFTGVDNSGAPLVAPPGITAKPWGHTAVEAELVKQRELVREDACAIYRMLPPMLGYMGDLSPADIEALERMAYTQSLAPDLVLIEEAINAQVIRHVLREENVYCEFDFSGVLRGDALKEINMLRLSIMAGLRTVNEARDKLNLPRSTEDAADQLFVMANNLRPLSDLPKAIDPNAPAAAGQPASGSADS